jgi:hypothetical protein
VLDLLGSRQLGLVANLGVRALLGYFGTEALKVTISDPSDRRFAGKGIAVRNALLLGSFSLLLPGLHSISARQERFPWTSDAVLLTVPVLDMAGNSLDLYNQYGWFDSVAHFYGNAAVGALITLAMAGRDREPPLARWLIAAGGTTFLHVALEMQEYWTDVWFGTHNVEGLEDTEGDLAYGWLGTITGVALMELALRNRRGSWLRAEGQRLAASLATLFDQRGDSRLSRSNPVDSRPTEN